MAEQVRVVVDAMGGDNAPAEPVRAAVEAVEKGLAITEKAGDMIAIEKPRLREM